MIVYKTQEMIRYVFRLHSNDRTKNSRKRTLLLNLNLINFSLMIKKQVSKLNRNKINVSKNSKIQKQRWERMDKFTTIFLRILINYVHSHLKYEMSMSFRSRSVKEIFVNPHG